MRLESGEMQSKKRLDDTRTSPNSEDVLVEFAGDSSLLDQFSAEKGRHLQGRMEMGPTFQLLNSLTNCDVDRAGNGVRDHSRPFQFYIRGFDFRDDLLAKPGVLEQHGTRDVQG